MKMMAAGAREHELPRERRLSVCMMIGASFSLFILVLIYCDLIFLEGYDLQHDIVLVVETTILLSALMLGMCLFRFCSLNDIAPKSIWHRVAVAQSSPLKLLEWDLESGNITYFEYSIDYGEYPQKLHEPLVKEEKAEFICNARKVVKITKKDADELELEYGAIYFHYKGDDEYLLDRWKYQFGKYHNKIGAVFKKCNKLQTTLATHFGWKTKVKILDPSGSKSEMMPKGSFRLKAQISDDAALAELDLDAADAMAERVFDPLKADLEKRKRAFSAESMSLKQGATYEPTPMSPPQTLIFDAIEEDRSTNFEHSLNLNNNRSAYGPETMEELNNININVGAATIGDFMSTHDYESEGSEDNVPDIRDIDPALIMATPSRKNTGARSPGSAHSQSPGSHRSGNSRKRTASRPPDDQDGYDEVYEVVDRTIDPYAHISDLNPTLVAIHKSLTRKHKTSTGQTPDGMASRKRTRTESGPPPQSSLIPKFTSGDLHATISDMHDEEWLHRGMSGELEGDIDEQRDPKLSDLDLNVLDELDPKDLDHIMNPKDLEHEQTPPSAPPANYDTDTVDTPNVMSPFEPADRGIDAYYHEDGTDLEGSDEHHMDPDMEPTEVTEHSQLSHVTTPELSHSEQEPSPKEPSPNSARAVVAAVESEHSEHSHISEHMEQAVSAADDSDSEDSENGDVQIDMDDIERHENHEDLDSPNVTSVQSPSKSAVSTHF